MAMSKKTPGINGSSMADISFILLIFFLMVTTMGTNFGLMRKLPPMVEKPQDEKVNERNVLVVNVNQQDLLMVAGSVMDVSNLRAKAKDFFDLKYPDSDLTHPKKKVEKLDILGNTTINDGAVVSLQNDRGTSYRIYIQVQNELAAAVNELRNEFCLQHFGKKFDECSPDEQKVVSDKVYPMSISEAEPKNIGGKK